MLKEPFTTENFDTVETQVIYDIHLLKSQINNLYAEIGQKEQTRTTTQKDIDSFRCRLKNLKLLTMGLTEMPFVKVYRKYNYFIAIHPLSKTFYN